MYCEGEDVRHMELGSNTKEFPVEMVDNKKRQRMYMVNPSVSHKGDSKDLRVPSKISVAVIKQTNWT